MNYCGRCGECLDTGASFCRHCGRPVLAPPCPTPVTTPPTVSPPPPIRTGMRRRAKVALGGMGALLISALLASAAHNNSSVAPTASLMAHSTAKTGTSRAAVAVPVRHTPLPSATVDNTQGEDSAPFAQDTSLPVGVTSSGCMIGTHGHSVVMVYTESPYGPTSDCRRVAAGDYLYTKAPALSTLVRYCSASKTDGSVTLDVYDKPSDLALPKYPEVGTTANAICAVFQSNNQWLVDRDMALVPTYIPGSASIGVTATADTGVSTDPNSNLASDEGGTGPTAECNDGTTSYSKHPSGTCSYHGGVAVWDDHLLHSTP